MHSIITSCSCVISMDLTVCHKQIAEEWRQQIIVVAKHEGLGLSVDINLRPKWNGYDTDFKARQIGHFRVPKSLTFKARLSAKPLI